MGACVSNKSESTKKKQNNNNNNNLIKMSFTKHESNTMNSGHRSSYGGESRVSKQSYANNVIDSEGGVHKEKEEHIDNIEAQPITEKKQPSHIDMESNKKRNYKQIISQKQDKPLSDIEKLFSFDNPFHLNNSNINFNNNDTYIRNRVNTYLNKYYFNFTHKKVTFSTYETYNVIINSNPSDKLTIASKLLLLEERSWYKETIALINKFSKDRDNSSNEQFNLFLHHTMLQHSHFAWISYAIALYCHFTYFIHPTSYNANPLFKESFKFNLPSHNESNKWYDGFQWKGLYIKLLPYYCCEATIIREEVNALNYAFFDYMQILNNVVIEDSAVMLSNELVFPLMNYVEIGNMMLVISAQARIKNAEGYVDITKYTITDLNESRIFRNIKENNLIQLPIALYSSSYNNDNMLMSNKYKCFLIDVASLIPKLFGIDTNYTHNSRHMKLFPIFKCEECKYTTLYNLNSPSIIEDIYNNKSISFSHIKTYNTIYNGIQYKLLYTKGNKKCFITTINNDDNNININDHIMLFRFIKETKLKYSLINYIPSKNQNSKYVYESISHFQMKYISHFDLWCKLHSTSNQNILSVYSLKQNAHRYGINMSMMFFALINILNNTNTSSYAVNITDIIKIYILVSTIKHIYNEGNKLLTKQTSLTYIYDIIQMILYPTLFSKTQTNINMIQRFYRKLRYYLQLKYMKWYLIDEYMQLGVFHNETITNDVISMLKNPKDFLETMLITARHKSFLFISTLEKYLRFNIDPYIKYISSISLESFQSKMNISHIDIAFPNVCTYIIPEEINSYLFARAIMSVNVYDTFDTNFSSMPLSNIYGSGESTNIIRHNLNNKIFTTNKNKHDNESSFNTHINTNTNMNNITCNIIINDTDSSFNNDHTPKPLTVYKNKSTLERICDKLIVLLSPICYKQKFTYHDTTKKVSYCLNKIYSYLTNHYCIKNIDMLFKWMESSQKVFNNIHSYNNTCLHELIRVYINYLFFTFKIKKDKSTSETILSKLKETINHYEYITIPYQFLAIIHMLIGDMKEGFLPKEPFYSRAVILSLLSYGDARGKYNDGCGFILYPLWFISRQVCTLENINILSEYFKELFHCQDYFTKLNYNGGFCIYKGGDVGMKAQQLRGVTFTRSVDYINNQYMNCGKLMHLYRNEMNLFRNMTESYNLMVDIDEDNNSLLTNMGVNINSELDTVFTLSESNYNDNINKAFIIKPFTFRNITDKAIELNEESFKSDEFIIYLYKHIQLFLNEGYACSNNNSLMFIENDMMNFNSCKGYSKRNNDNKKFGKYCVLSHYIHEILYEKLSYRKYMPSGTVISFGRNNYNETTHEHYTMLDLPRVVYKLKNEYITNVKCGWEHNVAINKHGEVFTWGNNTTCQCGIKPLEQHEYTIKISTPINLSKLNDNFIIMNASCGNEHTLFLHKHTNTIYGIGNNMDGVLAQSDLLLKTCIPIEIQIPSSHGKVISISSGTVHNIALTSKGAVFAWGSAQGGQLGLSEQQMMTFPNFTQSYCIYKPTYIPQLSNVISISTGEAHSIALCNSGRVYAWGFGSNGQLGLGFCEDSFEPGTGLTKSRVLLPQMVHTFTEEVKDVQCGKTFTMLITKGEQVYGCGVNDLYQLGLGYSPENKLFHPDMKCDDFTIPTLIETIPFKIGKIACGEGHCMAVLKGEGGLNLWSWGNNQWGQLGIGLESGIKKSLPKPVAWMLNNGEWYVKEISCGGFHSMCVVERKGEKDYEEEDWRKIIVYIRDAKLDVNE